jgi:hypothetical protein
MNDTDVTTVRLVELPGKALEGFHLGLFRKRFSPAVDLARLVQYGYP